MCSVKPWSNKRKRLVIGIFMMSGFLDLAYTIYFFSQFGSMESFFLGIVVFNYFWVPNLLLIILCYHVLTKIYKYEGKADGGLADSKVHKM